ncbi:MAG: ABC transporter permease [Bacteroidales bacterium]|nr:ABC transporter permease [Bacteroidales bacterium]
MFKNIIKVTLRKISKEFGYNLIIILSLTIGIVSSLFLLMYVFDDLSYDQFHKNKDRIVRVLSHITESDEEFTWYSTQRPFGPQAKEDYPEIEEFVRIIPNWGELFIDKDAKQYTEDVAYTDSSFFKVFTFDLIKGDPLTVLARPNAMVVTESFAKKYFGNEDPYGETIRTASGKSFEITGIMKDIPNNSHLTFSALISKPTESWEDNPVLWGNFSIITYLLLAEGTDVMVLQQKMKEMYDKYMEASLRESNWHVENILEPLTDIYLKSDVGSDRSGDIKYVYIFSIVAFFILLIASINYMNLATSRSTYRAKEVGLRKVAGSHRWPLILQFLAESVIQTLISLILSIIIIIVLLPSYNQITGKLFDIHYLINPQVILTLIAIVVFIGLIGGSYPAFYLSRFNPVSVIKQETKAGMSNFYVRRILVVLQFAISIALIINTWVIYKQLNYLKNKELGFDPHNIIIMELKGQQIQQKYPVIRDALMQNPNIINVSSANNNIGSGALKYIFAVETSEGMQEKGINSYAADCDFIETMGIAIVEGRNFSRDFLSDTTDAVIINETAAQRFGWDAPLDKRITNKWAKKPFRVVGVMKDFHQDGLYNPIETLMLILKENNYYVSVKFKDENIKETLQYIESKWTELFPESPFEYTFLEDDFAQQFKADERKGVIFTYFSVLIIIIACLGIIGLASFTVEQRTKEIGIRKVLGASISRIIFLISSEFLILVGISMVLAFAGAYFYMKNWLQDYTYPTRLDPWIFICAGMLAIIVTLVSTIYSAIRAGLTNPAESLRLE